MNTENTINTQTQNIPTTHIPTIPDPTPTNPAKLIKTNKLPVKHEFSQKDCPIEKPEEKE